MATSEERIVPDILLDDYHDIHLDPPSPLASAVLSPASREGFGSRLLSSLAPNTPAAGRPSIALHSRAKSWASYASRLSSSGGASSPASLEKPSNRQSSIFADLFHGESAPVQLGMPTSPAKEEPDFVMEYTSVLTERPLSRHLRAETTRSLSPTAQPARGGKLSWFNRKPSSTAQPSAPTPPPAARAPDEFADINLHASLFPHGPADPLSPHAFNDLLLNATALLQRMQAAYRDKIAYIATLQPELEARQDEVDEARTRSQHLKLQLEDIGRQAEEQRTVNQELILELAEQKMALQEARERTRSSPRAGEADDNDDASARDRRCRRKRASAASDSGFESDADSSSVFSAFLETPASARIHPAAAAQFFPRAPPSVASVASSSSSSSSALARSSIPRSSPPSSDPASSQHFAALLRAAERENETLRAELGRASAVYQGAIDYIDGVRGGR